MRGLDGLQEEWRKWAATLKERRCVTESREVDVRADELAPFVERLKGLLGDYEHSRNCLQPESFMEGKCDCWMKELHALIYGEQPPK